MAIELQSNRVSTLRGKRAMVLGIARSGVAAAGLLLRCGASVVLCDSRAESAFGDALSPLIAAGAVPRLGEAHPEGLLEGLDMLVVSPGIPDEHPAVTRARAIGVEVLGEIELAWRCARGLVIAITGTNGKSTTTALTGEIFRLAGRRTFVVGNIGVPWSGVADGLEDGDVSVCEISSFMMETASAFHPRISAVLNISGDHLNRHHTMARYIALKERIFENCAPGDYLVLNRDDSITRDMASRAGCRVLWFSTRNPVSEGAFIDGGMIRWAMNGHSQAVCRADEVFIPGEHNLQNALAASATALCAGVPADVVAEALRRFRGLEHRIEFVRELRGVRFYNDSKGTNVDSTIVAIRAMTRPTVLILGGSPKDTDYAPLCREIMASKVTHIELIGQTAPEIEAALRAAGCRFYSHAGRDFRLAIQRCFRAMPEGGSVLLSPACASFDMFDDFEQRGERFKAIVNSLEQRRTENGGSAPVIHYP